MRAPVSHGLTRDAPIFQKAGSAENSYQLPSLSKLCENALTPRKEDGMEELNGRMIARQILITGLIARARCLSHQRPGLTRAAGAISARRYFVKTG
jgi:hypothetical protein